MRKIRDETDTKIDFPRESSESDVITITGKKENVEKAKKMIEAIEKETVLVDVSCLPFLNVSFYYRLYADREAGLYGVKCFNIVLSLNLSLIRLAYRLRLY